MAPTSPYASYSLASTFHRIAGMHQSMQMLESARQKFEDAVKKFPNYVDGLVLYALVRERVCVCVCMHAHCACVCACACECVYVCACMHVGVSVKI